MKLTYTSIFFLAVAAAAQPLPIEGIAHVGYRVHDLSATAAWYTDVLGYPRAFVAADGSVFYRVGEEQYLEFTPGLDPGSRCAPYSYCAANELYKSIAEAAPSLCLFRTNGAMTAKQPLVRRRRLDLTGTYSVKG